EPQNGPKLISFLKAMEFTTLVRRVAEATDTDASAVEPCHVETEWGADARGPDLDLGTAPEVTGTDNIEPAAAVAGGKPSDLVAWRTSQALAQKIDTSSYTCIRDLKLLESWLDEALEKGVMSFDTETNSLDPMQADLIGF